MQFFPDIDHLDAINKNDNENSLVRKNIYHVLLKKLQCFLTELLCLIHILFFIIEPRNPGFTAACETWVSPLFALSEAMVLWIIQRKYKKDFSVSTECELSKTLYDNIIKKIHAVRFGLIHTIQNSQITTENSMEGRTTYIMLCLDACTELLSCK